MIFTETKLKGAFVIDLERRDRLRVASLREAFAGRNSRLTALSRPSPKPTSRITSARAPCAGCISNFRRRPKPSLSAAHAGRSSISSSTCVQKVATYLQHIEVELNEDNQRALYVPERFAHGYQTLRDNTDTSYQVGEFYTPSAEGGLMYNDPKLGLKWPLPVSVISDKDQKFELLAKIEPEVKRKMARELAMASA